MLVCAGGGKRANAATAAVVVPRLACRIAGAYALVSKSAAVVGEGVAVLRAPRCGAVVVDGVPASGRLAALLVGTQIGFNMHPSVCSE